MDTMRFPWGRFIGLMVLGCAAGMVSGSSETNSSMLTSCSEWERSELGDVKHVVSTVETEEIDAPLLTRILSEGAIVIPHPLFSKMRIVYLYNSTGSSAQASLYRVRFRYSLSGLGYHRIKLLHSCSNEKDVSKPGITCPKPRRRTMMWAQANRKDDNSNEIEIFIFGGFQFTKTGGINYLQDMWRWSSFTRQWSLLNSANTPTARYGAATWSCNNIHFLLGGSPSEDTSGNFEEPWSFNGSMPDNIRWQRAGTSTVGGKHIFPTGQWRFSVYGPESSSIVLLPTLLRNETTAEGQALSGWQKTCQSVETWQQIYIPKTLTLDTHGGNWIHTYVDGILYTVVTTSELDSLHSLWKMNVSTKEWSRALVTHGDASIPVEGAGIKCPEVGATRGLGYFDWNGDVNLLATDCRGRFAVRRLLKEEETIVCPSPSNTPTSSPSATSSVSSSASITRTSTRTPSRTPTCTASLTPSYTGTRTVTHSGTASPSPTSSTSPSISGTPSLTSTRSSSFTSSASVSKTQTASSTPTKTTTSSATPTDSKTPTSSTSPSTTVSRSSTPSITPSITMTASSSVSPSPSSFPTTSPSGSTLSECLLDMQPNDQYLDSLNWRGYAFSLTSDIVVTDIFGRVDPSDSVEVALFEATNCSPYPKLCKIGQKKESSNKVSNDGLITWNGNTRLNSGFTYVLAQGRFGEGSGTIKLTSNFSMTKILPNANELFTFWAPQMDGITTHCLNYGNYDSAEVLAWASPVPSVLSTQKPALGMKWCETSSTPTPPPTATQSSISTCEFQLHAGAEGAEGGSASWKGYAFSLENSITVTDIFGRRKSENSAIMEVALFETESCAEPKYNCKLKRLVGYNQAATGDIVGGKLQFSTGGQQNGVLSTDKTYALLVGATCGESGMGLTTSYTLNDILANPDSTFKSWIPRNASTKVVSGSLDYQVHSGRYNIAGPNGQTATVSSEKPALGMKWC